MNPLDNMPGVRRRIYVAYWTVGVVLGAVQAGCAVAGVQPLWLNIALAVYAFLGGAVGWTAARNVPGTAGDDA